MSKSRLEETLKVKEKQKIKTKKRKKSYMWFGLGMIGLVGWSIIVPTFIGVIIGIIIDLKFETQYSWTLMLLLLGLALGCLNVWYWINKERKSIEKENKNDKNSS